MGTLIGLRVSPFTEKALWALDHHRIRYRYEEFLVMLGDPMLRLRTRSLWRGPSVPVFLDEGVRLLDSFEIARHADAAGSGSKLFPGGALEAIRRYNELSEKALDAARALLIPRMLENREAQIESLPPWMSSRMLAPVAALAIRHIAKAYSIDSDQATRRHEDLRGALALLRRDLAAAGGEYLLGGFSYADIAMAVVLQFVKPVDPRFMPVPKATSGCFANPELAAEFPDLVQWRDEVYVTHRLS